jgi:hypothetical protein
VSEILGLKDHGKFDGRVWTVENLRLQLWELLVLVLLVVALAAGPVLCFVELDARKDMLARWTPSGGEHFLPPLLGGRGLVGLRDHLCVPQFVARAPAPRRRREVPRSSWSNALWIRRIVSALVLLLLAVVSYFVWLAFVCLD